MSDRSRVVRRLALALLPLIFWAQCAAQTTTVFVVGHAEKAGEQGDVDLSDAGVARHRYGPLELLGQIDFGNELEQFSDLSAVAVAGTSLVVADDEGNTIHVLEPVVDRFRVARTIPLRGGDDEIDIEAMAWHDGALYVLGSHSARRKRIDRTRDEKRTYKKIKERLRQVEAQPKRDGLFRVRFDPQSASAAAQIDEISLRELLAQDAVLGRFSEIASKENGIDIEGLAADDEQLYLGFRGPVLRSNYVPVMALTFDAPASYQLRYVELDGRGIRDMTKVEEGFLIVAGPVGDASMSHRLYHWDGRDCLPGIDRAEPRGKVTLLGTIPAATGAKAEGLAVLEETNAHYEVLVVYDGAKGGNPTRIRVAKGR